MRAPALGGRRGARLGVKVVTSVPSRSRHTTSRPRCSGSCGGSSGAAPAAATAAGTGAELTKFEDCEVFRTAPLWADKLSSASGSTVGVLFDDYPFCLSLPLPLPLLKFQPLPLPFPGFPLRRL